VIGDQAVAHWFRGRWSLSANVHRAGDDRVLSVGVRVDALIRDPGADHAGSGEPSGRMTQLEVPGRHLFQPNLRRYAGLSVSLRAHQGAYAGQKARRIFIKSIRTPASSAGSRPGEDLRKSSSSVVKWPPRAAPYNLGESDVDRFPQGRYNFAAHRALSRAERLKLARRNSSWSASTRRPRFTGPGPYQARPRGLRANATASARGLTHRHVSLAAWTVQTYVSSVDGILGRRPAHGRSPRFPVRIILRPSLALISRIPRHIARCEGLLAVRERYYESGHPRL